MAPSMVLSPIGAQRNSRARHASLSGKNTFNLHETLGVLKPPYYYRKTIVREPARLVANCILSVRSRQGI